MVYGVTRDQYLVLMDRLKAHADGNVDVYSDAARGVCATGCTSPSSRTLGERPLIRCPTYFVEARISLSRAPSHSAAGCKCPSVNRTS